MKNYAQMTNEELAMTYQNTACDWEMNDLITIMLKRMKGIMTQVADLYKNIPNIDWNDRMGELQIALIKAIANFDVSRGYKFTTFCRSYFNQAMQKQYEIQTREKRFDPTAHHISYENMLENNEEGAKNDFDKLFDDTSYVDSELKQLLDTLKLSDKEYKTCVLLSRGESKSDIARAIGVSATMVNKYIAKVRTILVATY
jgi:DNA-directed RNA polymerase sigma subunit (sigma70/sigma32)